MTFRPDHQPEPGDATRTRLLDAAERLFAEKGFEHTSVRDITANAGTNVAAVNYHFGGKDNLYREVFHRRLADLRERRISTLADLFESPGGTATLEDVVSTFTSAFLEPLMDHSEGRLLIELIAREMVSPHLPRVVFFEEMIDPVRESLGRALRSVVPGLTEDQASRCVHSIIGQLVHVIHHAQLSEQAGRQPQEELDLHTIADHVTRFSIGGIRAIAGQS
ncbi:MAG: TetR/AcrR family transcriptional regulator [Acidobacteria bacterium]|nr:TetR/AcrR family transcriptional regulator [Acidobacteriota bacterium]